MSEPEPSPTMRYRLRDIAVLLAAIIVAGAAGLNAGWFLAVPNSESSSKQTSREQAAPEALTQAAAASSTTPETTTQASSSDTERSDNRNIRVILPGPPTAQSRAPER